MPYVHLQGSRTMDMLMRTNFKQYWKEHLFGHFLPPLVCMYLAMSGYPIAAVIPLMQMLRQTVGYWEKKDTVSYDMTYIVAGAFVGTLIGRIIII